MNDIDEIAGFDLSDKDKAPFLRFHRFLSHPAASFVKEWQHSEKGLKWYHTFVGGMLTDVQQAFCCVTYHYANIYHLENRVIEAAEKHNFRHLFDDRTSAGIGGTSKLDFEYQAFILAYRRCLDYLAISLSAYFKGECKSFNELGNWLATRRAKREVALALSEVHATLVPDLSFVMSDGDRHRSVRDFISHYGYVSAGTINLSKRGLVIAGGGEKLSGVGVVLLHKVLSNRMIVLRDSVRLMIQALVDSVEAAHSSSVDRN